MKYVRPFPCRMLYGFKGLDHGVGHPNCIDWAFAARALRREYSSGGQITR